MVKKLQAYATTLTLPLYGVHVRYLHVPMSLATNLQTRQNSSAAELPLTRDLVLRGAGGGVWFGDVCYREKKKNGIYRLIWRSQGWRVWLHLLLPYS